MSFLRFLMFLSLVVWVGGLIFFPVVAQTSFSVLPTRHLAGNVVGTSLKALHWMGIVSGFVFLACSLIGSYIEKGVARPFALRNLLIVTMLALTLVSQFAMIPRMDAIRNSIGEIDSVSATDPSRMQFDRLHAWSTRLEEGVLLMGLVVLYLTSRSVV